MEILFIITSSVFLSLSILFLILYKKTKTKYIRVEKDFQENKNKFNKFVNDTKEILLTSKRIGFYNDTINLMSKKDKDEGKPGEPYQYIVYVKEIEKYTNGMSKIELTNLELVSGFDSSQFDWSAKCVRRKFSSIKKSSDIEWLELEEDIKEQRKLKLEKILNGI